MKPRDVAVLGGGSFGTALATIMAEQGHDVCLWVRREQQAQLINEEHDNPGYIEGRKLPERVWATCDLEEAVVGSPVVLMVVPSAAFREVASRVGDYLQGDQVLVHATKGLEVETFRRMSEVLREETCALKIGVLSGPNLSAELMKGQPAGAVLASRYREVIATVQELFAGSHLRLYGGRDIVGTEIGGSFKNIIAIAAGVADGLGFGANAASLLVTRGLSEMARFGVRLGADVFTFGGLAGIGDLMATCGSKLSRNHQVGEGIASGLPLEEVLSRMKHVAEGVPTTKAVHRKAQELGVRLPIVEAVHALLYEGMEAQQAVASLMSRPVGDELAALRYD